ncbi:MAG TPA: hypothetical protein VGL72_20655 [Bryobacteraceae bacterium]|jgi:hypothetical protein
MKTVLAAAAGIVILVTLLWSQITGGLDALRARARADEAMRKAYASQPGGASEENLFAVLILMGVGDREPSEWNGTVGITSGDIDAIDGYRFELPDRVLPQGGWRMKTNLDKILSSSPVEGSGVSGTVVMPKGLLITGRGADGTNLAIESNNGRCDVAPMQLVAGTAKACSGRITAMRVPNVTDLSGTELREHDFPALGAGAKPGELWATWTSFHDNRQELNLRHFGDSRWSRLLPVGHATDLAERDLYRPQVAVDETGTPWLIWSGQPAGEPAGNWEIFAMAFRDQVWEKPVTLSSNPGPDIDPHVAQGPHGSIYVTWQSLEGRASQIRMRSLTGGKWSEIVHVTDTPQDNWAPAIAVGSDGAAWIAWDRYNKSYDVYARHYTAQAGLGPEVAVAATERFEAYASVAIDHNGRPWIAYETGGVNWGKDLGAALGEKAPGTPLGGPRQIEIVCLDGDRMLAPPTLPTGDALALGSQSNSDPLLYFDPNGTAWLTFKRRYSRNAYRPSTLWETYLTRLDGDHWTTPMPLAKSWTRKSTHMTMAASGGRLWAFWPNENRDWAFASRPHSNRVMAGSIALPASAAAPALRPWTPPAVSARAIPAHESEDVAAIRAHRAGALRIVRGDLHRHTELSQDIGGLDDGALVEFYRYMIDAASMDFGASTDHQGGGTDYWNYLTQEFADMFHFPQRFSSLYAYERNMGNPFGHRNIIHTRRNYSILPFFQRMDKEFEMPDTPDGELLTFNSMSFGGAVPNDTQLLYESLRKSGGLAIPHTSATDTMGTDWRDNDPKLDPVLEIYQGARQNYETKNAPRGIKDGEEAKALGGYQEAGLVWNAWKKGYRIGVIASSDHYSTHISYAMVYTPSTSREAIFNSIRQRHTYGATDNIVLEFWLGSHFMGDDFTAASPQRIRVRVQGTDTIEAIHLIRDAQYIYKWSPNAKQADFQFSDAAAGKGQHWYYVRIEQKNGELAWSSPIWVKY